MKTRVFKQTMAIILVLAMLLGMAPGMDFFVHKVYAESQAPLGAGTEADPYQIASAANLLWIAENNVIENGFSGKYFKMTADINFSAADFQAGGAFYNDGAGWIPIGTISCPFNGTFDGNGYSVTGLFINRSLPYTGLFGVAGTGAVIANMSLEDVVITGAQYTGGLVGEINGTISNSHVGGVIQGSFFTGGLAGRSTFVIDNSYSTGRVEAKPPQLVTGWGFGGLAGENTDTGRISHSYSDATVSGESFGDAVGGLVGENRGAIEQSYSVSAISGKNYAGGLAGTNTGSIANSFAYGPVTCSNNGGGLVGSSWDGSILNSYAAGAVTVTEYYSGGLTSENSGTITDSYYDSNTTMQSDSDKGTPKTTAEMKTKGTFTGWDFNNTWAIVDTSDHFSYPYLQWMACAETEAPGYDLKSQGGGAADGVDTGSDGNTYYYRDNGDGTATLTDASLNASEELVIPDTLDGLTVTRIGEYALDRKDIKKVKIPDSVTEIGEGAFEANQLMDITIPSGVAIIGNYSFNGNKISNVVILNNSGISLGEGAFAGNQGSKPGNLRIYGYSNSSPETYAENNSHTFVALNPDGGGMVTVDGNIYIYIEENGGSAVAITGFACTSSTDIEIPQSINGIQVAKIGARAFENWRLTGVTIPEGVTDIGDYAFSGKDEDYYSGEMLKWSPSNKLASITVPASVASIGEGAFSSQGYRDGEYNYKYNTLTEVIFLGGADSRLESIGAHAFEHNALENVEIPQNVVSIGEKAFFEQYNNDSAEEGTLETVTFAGGADNKLENIGKSAFEYNIITDVAIPDNVTTIADSAFAHNRITSITIPDSVTTIGQLAFSNNELTAVTIPDGVTSIGEYAFEANQLNKVIILSSNISIGEYAFAYNQDTAADLAVYGLSGSNSQAYASTANHTFKAIAVPSGDGSQEHPYLISSPDNLTWMSLMNADNEGFEGKYFKQTADIDMSSIANFSPIGDTETDYGFEGSYDGQGHKLSRLTMDTTMENAGLFGVVDEDGEIKNLTIEDASIQGTNESAKVGAVAGVNYGLIENCHAKASQNGGSSIEAAGEEATAGGIAGRNSGTISKCSNAASVQVGGAIESGSYYSGGITGKNFGGTIENCFNIGNISNSDGNANTIALGGIAGGNMSEAGTERIQYCYSLGTVTLTGSGYKGGIAGITINSASITNNFYLSGMADNGITTFGPGGFTGSNEGAEPKTLAELQTPSTYAGWDTDIWTFVQGSLPEFEIQEQEVPVTYTVTYNGNGNDSGTVPTDSNHYAQGTTVTVFGNTNGLAKSGYAFAGWNTLANGGGTTYNANSTFRMGSQNIILYAKWTPHGSGDNGNEGGSNNNNDSGSGTATPPTNGSRTDIVVDGKKQDNAAAITTTTGNDGQTTTTVTIDNNKLIETLEKLNAESTGENSPVISIPVNNNNSDKVVGVLNGQTVKAMEEKEMVLEIKTPTAAYTLPAKEIKIDAVSSQFREDLTLSDIKVQVEIAKPSAEAVKAVEDSANKDSFALVVPPVEFSISCTYKNKTVEVSQFNSYVERTIAIPEGVDPQKITTGIVVEPDRTVRHVPTKITVIEGKYYAQINSLTNSTYSVVWHPVEFKDVEKHWAKEAVNDMGSRMVISGIGNDMYAPDRDITRAEFAAIMVRALGLKPGTGKVPFADVKGTDWHSGYIATAAEYKLVSGYGNGQFGPNDKITREQAMTMIARAMKLTNLRMEFSAGELEKLLGGFKDADQMAGYSKDSIAACIKAGIVSGKNGKHLAPKDDITRVEVAVIVRRLLQKSGLI